MNEVTNAKIRRGFEGPQLVLSWTNPGTFDLIKIRRGVLEFPQNLTDGVEVYSGIDEIFSDVNVINLVTYYYTIFTIIAGTPYFSTKTQIYEFPIDNQAAPLELYKLLPEFYREEDLKQRKRSLETGFDDESGWLNYWEDQFVEHGPLRRFLKLFGLEFGNIRGMIESFELFYDVLNVRLDFLPLLASYVGLTLIPNESQQRQRFLILNAIYLYRIRGTLEDMALFAGNIVGEKPLIKEYRNNIVYHNVLNSTFLEGAVPPGSGFDPVVVADMGKFVDNVDYMMDFSPGAKYSPRSVGFFFTVIDPTPFISTIVAYFRDFVPATVNWFLFFNDVQVYP